MVSQSAVFLKSCMHIEFSESQTSSLPAGITAEFKWVSGVSLPASFLLVSWSLALTALSLGLCPGASKHSKS